MRYTLPDHLAVAVLKGMEDGGCRHAATAAAAADKDADAKYRHWVSAATRHVSRRRIGGQGLSEMQGKPPLEHGPCTIAHPTVV